MTRNILEVLRVICFLEGNRVHDTALADSGVSDF